jgi:hypothetical protein
MIHWIAKMNTFVVPSLVYYKNVKKRVMVISGKHIITTMKTYSGNLIVILVVILHARMCTSSLTME